jgi:exonuclease III
MIIATLNLQYNSPHPSKNLLNIQKISNTYAVDFYLFQEATIYNNIIPILHNYKHVLHQSGREDQITFYSKKYRLLNIILSEFERGRPCTCLLFQSKMSNELYIIINVHAGHHSNYKNHIFEPLQKIINKWNIHVKNIIIGGDFNVYVKKYNFYYKGITYQLLNKGFMKTCCKNNDYKYNFDYVLTNMNFIKKTIVFDKGGSDHRLVLTEIEKN